MLICNNCSRVNDDGALRCVHCNMKGNFSPYEPGERRSDELFKEQQPVIQCRNCGSPSPGDGDRCAHCRFPLPAFKVSLRQEAKPGALENRYPGSEALHSPSYED